MGSRIIFVIFFKVSYKPIKISSSFVFDFISRLSGNFMKAKNNDNKDNTLDKRQGSKYGYCFQKVVSKAHLFHWQD